LLAPQLEILPNFSSVDDEIRFEDRDMSDNVELRDMIEEQLEVRCDEEYVMGSLQVRCGADGARRSERG
jgi:hypothetical protein